MSYQKEISPLGNPKGFFHSFCEVQRSAGPSFSSRFLPPFHTFLAPHSLTSGIVSLILRHIRIQLNKTPFTPGIDMDIGTDLPGLIQSADADELKQRPSSRIIRPNSHVAFRASCYALSPLGLGGREDILRLGSGGLFRLEQRRAGWLCFISQGCGHCCSSCWEGGDIGSLDHGVQGKCSSCLSLAARAMATVHDEWGVLETIPQEAAGASALHWGQGWFV